MYWICTWSYTFHPLGITIYSALSKVLQSNRMLMQVMSFVSHQGIKRGNYKLIMHFLLFYLFFFIPILLSIVSFCRSWHLLGIRETKLGKMYIKSMFLVFCFISFKFTPSMSTFMFPFFFLTPLVKKWANVCSVYLSSAVGTRTTGQKSPSIPSTSVVIVSPRISFVFFGRALQFTWKHVIWITSWYTYVTNKVLKDCQQKGDKTKKH